MAGRAKVGGDVTPVRFADGVLARIDAVAGKGRRAEFIRDAVAAALSGGVAAVGIDTAGQTVAVLRGPAVPAALSRRRVLDAAEQERSDKMKLLLEAVRRRAMTARDASLELGWPEILTAKVADKLFAAGLVHFPRGAGVMEAKG